MASAGGWSGVRTGLNGRDDTYDVNSFGPSEAREPGARRRKIAGYLKAARELKDNYKHSYTQGQSSDYERSVDSQERIPGAYPARRVEHFERLVIFPSYSRRKDKQRPEMSRSPTQYSVPKPGTDYSSNNGDGSANWSQQWDQREDERAIVDVDVRGWLYTRHTEPLNRKNRLWVNLASKLVGIPVSTSNTGTVNDSTSDGSSPHGLRERMEAKTAKHEDELAAKEAANLLRVGEEEAVAAGAGAYSELPGEDSDDHNTSYRERTRRSSDRKRSSIAMSQTSTGNEDTPISISEKRTWTDPARMSSKEIEIAQGHLMTRLAPFMATSLVAVPISAFFYNESRSRQLSVDTGTDGQFNIRAHLDFVPTHVRVISSENVSVTEEIHLTESEGVSIISDIDDTVKHSAIGSGAREIFRNVFIRELRDLKIRGVREWYSKLASLDAKFHYVSNSPWQLYPVLTQFFTEVGLPTGSIHLKQYNGMLQGIFEPVAERKKGPLEKILRDFPRRKFILIGDSGEADLEVYTDIVLEHPGRIVGVFIRDVTTPISSEVYDPVWGPLSGEPEKMQSGQGATEMANDNNDVKDDDPALRAAIKASLDDSKRNHNDNEGEERRPPLPPRRESESVTKQIEEDLIDLNFEDSTNSTTKLQENALRPSLASRGQSTQSITDTTSGKRQPPPKPSKPSSSVLPKGPPPSYSQAVENSAQKPALPPRPTLRTSTAPSLPSKSASNNNLKYVGRQTSDPLTRGRPQHVEQKTGPPPPPRAATGQFRSKAAALSATAVQYASSLYASARAHSPSTSSSSSNGVFSANKKEDLWRQRWARAKEVLDGKGVMLRGWRAGEDVINDAVSLIHRQGKRADVDKR